MGIRSLTTYLENRSKQYFESYQLHDCDLVIDGSSLCFNLFNWKYYFLKTGYSYECYGGDYDKFAEIVKAFFEMLDICNVKPYIVFGGRNGTDRLSIIKNKNRLDEKVKLANEISPNVVRDKVKFEQDSRWRPNQNLAVGDVSLQYAFRDVLNELNLKAFTCEEEPNREIACLAKYLKCPVLSANSDFFMLGSMFIPFSSMPCNIQENIGNWTGAVKNSYKFIPCKLYKIENLLDILNKRPNNNFIPYLLPVLLGSDYINQEIFYAFFKSIRIDRLRTRQQKIDGIFDWIKKQNTLEAALKHILDTFDSQEEKNFVSEQINRAIVGYSPVSIALLQKHFDIRANDPIGNANSKEADDVGKEEEPVSGSDLFMTRLRECRYPSFFMDISKENRYFLQPNIEDCTKPDANSIGYTVMSAIHNILVQSDEKQLTVLRRGSSIRMEEYILPLLEDQLPSVDEIDYLLLERRRDILLKVLEIEEIFCDIFEGLPKEWQLFLLSLKYCNSKSDFDPCFVYSLLLCFIVLNYVDSNLKGFYRTVKDFQDIHKVNQNNEVGQSGKNEFPQISEYDSFIFMQKCIKYFEMDDEDNAQSYDRGILHAIAEFQCVFVHLKYLNNLLDFPFEDAFIYKIFDGTFVYNMTKQLNNKGSLKDYLKNFLQDCPTIQCGLFYVVEMLEEHAVL